MSDRLQTRLGLLFVLFAVLYFAGRAAITF